MPFDKDGTQIVLMGKTERLYREFRDSTTAHALTNPTNPSIVIYDPDGTEFVASSTPTQESTGVYYYAVTVTTASASKEGDYQAWWSGTIDGALVSMDEPQYFRVKKVPQARGELEDFVNAVRRAVGDVDARNQRISDQDLWYFIQDAIDDVQSEHYFGYITSVSSTGLSLNKTLSIGPSALFKLRATILILKSVLMGGLFYAGSVDMGDIRVNVTSTLKERREYLKMLEEEYKRLMYNVKLNAFDGYQIDTYVTGLLINQTGGGNIIDPNIAVNC